MKKILIGLIVFIAISLSFEAQGQFNAARYKYDYFGGIKIGKTVEIGTTLTYTNKAGSFLGHIDSLVVDNVTTPTLFKLYSGLTELRTSPQTADYVIDKVGSTYYARPGIGTGYTAYSGATASTVINAAITAMTTGGDIYFKRGSYTITASIVDAGYSNVNLIFEKGAKLIAGNALNAPVIDLTTVSHWRIKGVEIDGNSANQAIPTANDGIKMNTVNDIIVSDAYIHDVREFGFYITGVSSYSGIINSTLTTCGWNGVQLGWINNGTYLFCKDCDISHCGDNGASLGGFAPQFTGNTVHDMDGILGYVSPYERDGVTAEFCQKALIQGNTFYNLNKGIQTLAGMEGSNITGNQIHNWDIDQNYYPAISVLSDSNLISSNLLYSTRAIGYGIVLYGSSHNQVSTNKISCVNSIMLQASSLNNLISNNKVACVGGNSYKIYIVDANCTGNKVIENDMSGGNYDLVSNGASTTIGNNIWYDGNYGVFKRTVTATSNGLDAGIIAYGSQNLTVTSNTNDAYIISLPAASAATIGTKITGLLVGGKICVLRTQAAQEASVYINGVTGAGKGAAIPVGSTFEVTQVDATHWILKAWTTLGAEITAIVPA